MEQGSSFIFNFKKFALRIGLLLVSAALVSYLIAFVFERKIILGSEVCGAYKVNRILNQNYPDEVPLFGSSRAEGSFIPDSLGINCFNYGIAGTQDNVLLMFLRAECKKKKTTPFIIINYDMEGIDSAYGDISNYLLNADDPEIEAMLGATYKGYYRVPVIKYFGQYEAYLKYYLNGKIQLTKYSNKGSYIERNALSPSKFQTMVKQRMKSSSVFRNETVLVKQLLEIINTNKNRHFIFVVAPYHASFFNRFRRLEEGRRFLDSLERMGNVSVFDFSSVTYPDDCFLNTTHVNYKGAISFSVALRDSLGDLRKRIVIK